MGTMPPLGDDPFAPQFLWPKDKGHSNVRPRICSFKLLKNESKKTAGHGPLGPPVFTALDGETWETG